MRTFTAVAAIALVSFGFTTSASAFKFSPASTSFTATGNTSLTKSGITVPCTAVFKGKTNAKGKGKITKASFTGSATCAAIAATGLPWAALATGAATANIGPGVGVTTPLGNCGPDTVPVAVNNTGGITFNNTLTGGCMVSGTLQTTPVVTIVP